MKVLKYDTLAFQLGVRPGTVAKDNGASYLPHVVSHMNTFMDSASLGSCFGVPHSNLPEKPKGNPEVDALVFYLLNHAVSVIRQRVSPLEPLGSYLPVVETYQQRLALLSARMFFYLLLICTRESRHLHGASSFMGKYGAQYPHEIKSFHATLSGLGSTGSAEKLRKDPPQCTLRDYTNFLVDVFFKGSFSSYYGGPAWGAVATVLRDFSVGTISAEMMMDTAFTLCHNNGPIFNKGMLFEGYSNEIYQILDVQRSGQIPQMLSAKETKFHSHTSVAPLVQLCSYVLPDVVGGYVDWFKVEELGSMKSYPNQKSQQVAKYGPPKGSKAVEVASKNKEAIKKAIELAAAEQHKKMTVEIMPGVSIQKVEVVR